MIVNHQQPGFPAHRQIPNEPKAHDENHNVSGVISRPSDSPIRSSDDSRDTTSSNAEGCRLDDANERRSPQHSNSPDGNHDSNDEAKRRRNFITDLQIPKYNSNGDIKKIKCRYCGHLADTKWEHYEHIRPHIAPEKRLNCVECNFCTDLKHHLEYHLLGHRGIKPFQCNKCGYRCINKSMLNSHLKSHSNVYQYRCAQCSYATKYCHSLKLHLRKYKHESDLVLNPDGTPSAHPIIDVYGPRRGPKRRVVAPKPVETKEQVIATTRNSFEQVYNQMQNPPMDLPFNTTAELLLPVPIQAFLATQRLAAAHMFLRHYVAPAQQEEPTEEPTEEPAEEPENPVLDLSKQGSTPEPKSPSIRLESEVQSDEASDDEKDHVENVNTVDTPPPAENSVTSSNTDLVAGGEGNIEGDILNTRMDKFRCYHCLIGFADLKMYAIHMGSHQHRNPFTCNLCGADCNDRVEFFVHMTQNQHWK